MNKSPHTAPAPNPGGALEPEGAELAPPTLAAPSFARVGTGNADPQPAPHLARPDSSILKTVCCVCKTLIRDGDLPISHGYCKPCEEAELAKIEASA